ncbi:iron-containing alcohol dehydrogenase [Candidatus Aerophobetes bacterium]|uniref:Iron-containing alcohol dehydrogenase n=1 Tax=Aerophobetes bacterium TaxID=2030807 RepID=A0A523W3F5_UNCAE|nr:MAG: iron-containing alcohol dehydrogenase [Candidatus Aerophobetes bacterium]
MNFEYLLARTELLFGEGVLKNIGDKVSKIGSKSLLVTGKRSMSRLGFLDETEGVLKKAGVEVVRYGGVEPNPTVGTVNRGAKLALEHNCDVVVGLGGGSAMDTAKAIAVLTGHWKEGARSIWSFSSLSEEKTMITPRTLPIVAITSTSGTGSHVTKYAVFTNDKTSAKPGIGSEFMYPRLSVVDLDIVSTMPPVVTATTGFDVLAHAMESIISTACNPISQLYALETIRMVYKYLPRAYTKGNDRETREKMALADTYAGWAIAVSPPELPHAMSHPISGYYPDISHGMALAIVTPGVICLNVEKGHPDILKKYSLIAQNMGKSVSASYTKEDALQAARAVEELRKRVGLDITLSKLGVTEDKIENIAGDVLTCNRGAWKNNPVRADRKEISELLRQCY